MTMKHTLCATIIALSLAACGSGGGGSPEVQPAQTPTPNTASPDAESSAVKNRSSLDYRRNYAGVVSSKSVIAAQTLLGPQAGSNTRGEKNLTLTLNGRSYGLADRINITALPDGLLELPYKAETALQSRMDVFESCLPRQPRCKSGRTRENVYLPTPLLHGVGHPAHRLPLRWC